MIACSWEWNRRNLNENVDECELKLSRRPRKLEKSNLACLNVLLEKNEEKVEQSYQESLDERCLVAESDANKQSKVTENMKRHGYILAPIPVNVSGDSRHTRIVFWLIEKQGNEPVYCSRMQIKRSLLGQDND